MSKLHDALNPTKPGIIPPYKQPVQQTAQAFPTGTRRGGWQPLAAMPLKKIESPVGLATALLGFYTLLYMAPIVEILAYYLNVFSPIVIVIGVMVMIAFPFTGHMGRFLRSPLAKPWLALMVCFILASVFSSYRGGSIRFMESYCSRIHILPFFFCAFALTTRQVRHLMFWCVGAYLVVLVFCVKYGVYREGRFALSQTSLENPNDLAFNLLLGCSFLIVLLFQRSWIPRLICAVALPLGMVFVLKTGSRANFVTIIVVAVLSWLLASSSTKAVFLAITPLLLVFVVILVPQSTRNRLFYIMSDPRLSLATTDDPIIQSAVGSQLARMELQKRAWKITMTHPLFGIGPLQFADVAESMIHQETGMKSNWQFPHNVYLEISSECGIPALIFFVWSIILCFTMNYRSYKMCAGRPSLQWARGQSYCLLLGSFVHAVGIFFCNVTYFPYLPILVGLTAANSFAVQQELSEMQKTAAYDATIAK